MLDTLTIERLKAMPIEDIAERLGLQVSRHKSLCPFHEDSRPSLTFNCYTNRYRCYVCDAHGGVIDLVMQYRKCGFKEAVEWLDSGLKMQNAQCTVAKIKPNYPPDTEWLNSLIRPKVLSDEARMFLFDERRIDPRVVDWCGLTSITQDMPCWRYGKAFYDAPAILIPYYDQNGILRSVQSRYLGTMDKPRFKFPRGSNCHIYGLQILKMLQPGEELWITEGCSDCWAMLSSGKKAIAIPSATLLKDKDIEPLKDLNLHMYPDQDMPGEKLYLELRDKLPQLERHQLPSWCKDFGELWKKLNAGI